MKGLRISIAFAVLLVLVWILFDVASAVSFAYPEYDYGQDWYLFFALFLLLPTTATIGLVRLVQRRFVQAAALIMVCVAAFALPAFVDGVRLKFARNKPTYLLAVKADTASSPKFMVFDWGNRNITLGGGVIFEAIVYDELGLTPRLGLAPSSEEADIVARLRPGEQWIAEASTRQCVRRAELLEGHFYHVVSVCG
jgi:hypothetical protein